MRVSLVTVGDELLAGDTLNSNAAWLGQQLSERGVDVERVVVVPDRTDDIAAVVNEHRATYDAVVVTGGLGPTHDDVTMVGVAAAFGTETVERESVYEWLDEKGYAREDLAAGTAAIPEGAELLRNPEGVAPGCVIGDVYVLPGVPAEMKAMFRSVAERFSRSARYRETVETPERESALVDRLATLRERFEVKVGCYPGETVRIVIQGGTEREVETAATWLSERVEPVTA